MTPASQEGPPLVLIVDDNEQNRRLTRDVLAASGFRTLEAASGAEGLALADERQPDVVLMDLRLPDMNGDAVARELGARPRTSSIPVVALSSVPLERDGLRSEVFAGYLDKPFDIRIFPAQVRQFCSAS